MELVPLMVPLAEAVNCMTLRIWSLLGSCVRVERRLREMPLFTGFPPTPGRSTTVSMPYLDRILFQDKFSGPDIWDAKG